MIKEYRTGLGYDGCDTTQPLWHGRRSVDLRYVTTASPYHAGVTEITVVGAVDALMIEADYETFMRDWQSVKR